MNQFKIVPTICQANNCREFVSEFQIGKKDLILTNEPYYSSYFSDLIQEAQVIFLQRYGQGEPTDVMVEAIWSDIKNLDFDRVIAIGGGTIIDIAKLIVQETVSPVIDLFDKLIPTKKSKELVIVPTTCGTGSEVTSVSVIELVSRNTKMGLQTDEQFADIAVLIPELLENLPYQFFGASAIDALIHACESFLSPKANAFTELFSKEAIRVIIKGFILIRDNGKEARTEYKKEFLLASNYAGIAFANAGCAAVHAMSLPFGGAHHVAHGEANYTLFTAVFKTYLKLKPVGKIQELNQLLAKSLRCKEDEVYQKLEELLEIILKRKSLSEYQVTQTELVYFTENVMNKQGRLMANNYTTLDAKTIMEIYEAAYDA